jgi:hypothetical protein
MSHKKKLHPFSHKPFAGSVEFIPPLLQFVEFIDADRLWGFPIAELTQFVLEDNPAHCAKQTSPPHQLTLTYPPAQVVLRGWRLELMVGPLVAGRVARVHAEKLLGPLVIEEPWVSEIHIHPQSHAGKAQSAPAEPTKSQP